jgi:hypothetical protein
VGPSGPLSGIFCSRMERAWPLAGPKEGRGTDEGPNRREEPWGEEPPQGVFE